jgi:delta-aminolevulinic acid dehydratase/porphobilinogen synthase
VALQEEFNSLCQQLLAKQTPLMAVEAMANQARAELDQMKNSCD